MFVTMIAIGMILSIMGMFYMMILMLNGKEDVFYAAALFLIGLFIMVGSIPFDQSVMLHNTASENSVF